MARVNPSTATPRMVASLMFIGECSFREFSKMTVYGSENMPVTSYCKPQSHKTEAFKTRAVAAKLPLIARPPRHLANTNRSPLFSADHLVRSVGRTVHMSRAGKTSRL